MRLLPVLLSALLLVSFSAIAGPVAPPVPWNKDYLQKAGKTAEELDANRSVPDAEEVGVPAYPGAYFHQSNTGIGDKLLSVVLVSGDEPDKVCAWYKENYKGQQKVECKPFTVYEWQSQIMDIKDLKTEIWIRID